MSIWSMYQHGELSTKALCILRTEDKTTERSAQLTEIFHKVPSDLLTMVPVQPMGDFLF